MSEGGIDPRRVELLRLGLELGIPAGELVAWAREAEAWLMPGPAAQAPRGAHSPEHRAAIAASWTPERRAAAAERLRARLAASKAAKTTAPTATSAPPVAAPPKPGVASTHPDAARIAEHIREHGVTKLPARHAETEVSRYRV